MIREVFIPNAKKLYETVGITTLKFRSGYHIRHLAYALARTGNFSDIANNINSTKLNYCTNTIDTLKFFQDMVMADNISEYVSLVLEEGTRLKIKYDGFNDIKIKITKKDNKNSRFGSQSTYRMSLSDLQIVLKPA